MVSFSIQTCAFERFTDPAATDIQYGEKPPKGSVPLRMFAFFNGKSSGFDSKDVGLELLKMRLSF